MAGTRRSDYRQDQKFSCPTLCCRRGADAEAANSVQAAVRLSNSGTYSHHLNTLSKRNLEQPAHARHKLAYGSLLACAAGTLFGIRQGAVPYCGVPEISWSPCGQL